MQRHWKPLLLAVIILTLTGSGAAITSYDIALDDGAAEINATIELYADSGETESGWRLSRPLPDGAVIHRINDSQGVIEDYTFDGRTLQFETNRAHPREKEVVDIHFTVPDVVQEEYRGVDLVRLRLAGFPDRQDDVPDEVTEVVLTADRQILDHSYSFGFDTELSDRSAKYRGDGPVNLYLTVSDTGEQYEHFTLFGAGNLTEADGMYGIVRAITGHRPSINRHPVIVLPDEEYDREVDAWSSGQYRTGGLIFIRESVMADERDMLPVLFHEVAHAYNEDPLRWTDTELGWFDEGIAKYVEFLIRSEQGTPQAEIFGDEVTWTGPCRSQPGQCRFTLSPRGTPDQLWDYYQRDSDLMTAWSPEDAPDVETRRFGYAFAELVIRHYVHAEGFDALHPVYRELLAIDEEVSDQSAATERVLSIMDTSLRPCDADDRDAFEQCLEEVNAMEPAVPDTVTIANQTTEITITPIERPEPPEQLSDHVKAELAAAQNEGIVPALRQSFQRLAEMAAEIVNNLFKRIRG